MGIVTCLCFNDEMIVIPLDSYNINETQNMDGTKYENRYLCWWFRPSFVAY
jgi:hypothetical protein